VGHASHGSRQPDSWIIAGARHHFAEGAVPSGCSVTWDSGRCHYKAVGHSALALEQLKLELDQLATCLGEVDALIQKAAEESEVCRRLDAIPGIGPLTATALIAAIGNGAAFRKGRDFAARVGLVPREHSTGGKQKLLGISKRGNCYLRTLFVQGARAVLQFREKQSSRLSAWLADLTLRTHYNVADVALANKLARMAWAVLTTGEVYRPPVLACR